MVCDQLVPFDSFRFSKCHERTPLRLSAGAQPLHDPQDKEHAGSELAPRLAESLQAVQPVTKILIKRFLRSGMSDARWPRPNGMN